MRDTYVLQKHDAELTRYPGHTAIKPPQILEIRNTLKSM